MNGSLWNFILENFLVDTQAKSCIDDFSWRHTCVYAHMSIQILAVFMHNFHPCSRLYFIYSLLALLQLMHTCYHAMLWFSCYYPVTQQTVSTRSLEEWVSHKCCDMLLFPHFFQLRSHTNEISCGDAVSKSL